MENNSLFEAWLEREDSYYEEKFFEPLVDALCQYNGGTTDGRLAKGRIFNAGYEVFIYAFFLGLYMGERRPLAGPTRKFRMAMSSWGRKSNEKDRKSYTILQKYIFIALVTKTDVYFLALDKGELNVNDVCKKLMATLNEYANTGFYRMYDQLKKDPDYFFGNTSLLDMIRLVVS
ncbi:MAG: glycoside hydrolase family 15 [Prevotella sp.]|jgi:hypothetical protein|nr:glycoside hydrolase family 15 [Prevotella sp.]MCH4183497.1 glycoside hydrolase family 15 [Prevotella sp.]MCH4213142.1 glycoside hydrolase family 15 [Prevotella sp.]